MLDPNDNETIGNQVDESKWHWEDFSYCVECETETFLVNEKGESV